MPLGSPSVYFSPGVAQSSPTVLAVDLLCTVLWLLFKQEGDGLGFGQLLSLAMVALPNLIYLLAIAITLQ